VSAELSAEDQRYLDELFGRFVEALTEGREVDLDATLAGREPLRPRALELLDLARQITVRQPVEAPHFAGYELISELGRGGMGRVYCVRHIELDRIEALKTLPAQWLVGDRSRTRFEREARAVASLAHPGIVPIYDVGTSEGVPFFTMELVEGRTLAGVLDGLRGLGQESRTLTAASLGSEGASSKSGSYVRLVAQIVRDIARALAHAHDEGIVHRDVKPSNVLLRPDGSPMLFDFGLASLAELGEDDALTLTGEFLGTPHYVSPEQAAGRPVSAATDMFSLGATLFELLTLERPFTGATSQDVLRAVQQREPRPPSAVNGDVPRDLDTVCLTALAKEPARRYASMQALAEDLDRYLEHRPILARRSGPIERAWRLVRRHPAPSIAVASVVLLLIGTPTALFLQARSANTRIESALGDAQASRVEALAQRDLARETAAALDTMFSSIAPENAGREVRVFEVLDDFAQELPGLRPEVRAPLERTLGNSYFALTLYTEAETHLGRALELYRSLPDPPAVELLALRADLGSLDSALGRYAEVLEHGAELLADFEALGVRDDNYAHAVAGHSGALIVTGNPEAAILQLEECILRIEVERPDAAGLTSLRFTLSAAFAALERYDAAIEILAEARHALAEQHGAHHPDVLSLLVQTGQLRREAGDLEGAEQDMRAALAGSTEVFGEDNLTTITVVHNLAGVYLARNEWELALEQELRAAELAELALPELHPLKGFIFEVLSTIYSQLEHDVEALAAQRRSLDVRLGLHGEAHPHSIQARYFLAERFILLADGEAAVDQLLRAREQLSATPGAGRALTLAVHSKLVSLLEAMGAEDRLPEARAALEAAREAYAE